jgi:hypothetical protein
MLHFGAGCDQIVTKTYELCHRVAFGSEICVRVAHGRNDSRMSEQLLDCHYIHSSIQQPGSERMPQLVARHTLDSGLSARETSRGRRVGEKSPFLVVAESAKTHVYFLEELVKLALFEQAFQVNCNCTCAGSGVAYQSKNKFVRCTTQQDFASPSFRGRIRDFRNWHYIPNCGQNELRGSVQFNRTIGSPIQPGKDGSFLMFIQV